MQDSRDEQAAGRRPSRWIPTDTLESGPDVVLAFHGLMCLCNHSMGFCEVGVLNTDRGKHDLRIFVMEVSSSFDPPTNIDLGSIIPRRLFTISDTGEAPTNTVTIDASRPRVRGVTVYHPSGQPKANPSDFRHIVDLEGQCFYDGEVTGKVKDAFGPRLRVRDAVFYTLCKTATEFVSREEGASRTCSVGGVARIVGANMYLEPGAANANVTIKINGQEREKLEPAPGKRYFVFVDNSCPTCPPKVSDFPQYYTAVNPPGMRKKIHLEKDVPGSGPQNGPCAPDFVKLLETVFGTPRGEKAERMFPAADDTPCGPTTVGASADLDA